MMALTAIVSLSFFGVKEKAQAFSAVREYSLQNVNDGVILSVEKVYRPVTWTGGEMVYLDNDDAVIGASAANYKKVYVQQDILTQSLALYRDIQNPNAQDNTTSTKTIIRNGGSVMLDDIRTETTGVTDVENIMVSFGSYNNTTTDEGGNVVENNNGQSIYVLNVSAYLNNQEIQVGVRPTASFDGVQYYDFTMFLDLNNATYATGEHKGEKLDNQEGRYDFTFTYQRKVNDVVFGQNQVDFSFYVLSKDNYTKEQNVSTGVTYNTQPTIRDAFKSGSNFIFGYKPNNATGAEYVEYPKLTLDLSKYAVSFTRMYSEVTENYRVDYDYATNTARIVKNRLGATSTTDPISLDHNGLLTIVFTDLGVYDFTYNVKYEDGDVIRDVPKYEIEVESQKLTIYGYQLKYNRNNNGDSELKYVEFYDDTKTGVYVLSELQHILVEDSTKLAGTIAYIESADLSSIGYNVPINTMDVMNPTHFTPSNIGISYNGLSLDKFVITNQGPLWFDYSMLSGETLKANNSRVFYAKNETTNFEAYSFANGNFYPNTTTSAGYYLIKITYGIEDKSAEQLFAFYVSSDSQLVSAYATDSDARPVDLTGATAINSYDYTNKNVFIDWQDPQRFENTITATYYYSATYNLNPSQMTVQNVRFDRDTTLFTQSGAYIVVITYAGDPNDTTEIPFIIDKEPISGISAKGVSQITDALNQVSYIYNGDDYTNRASIDQPFTLTWAEKASGANITIEYSFTELKEDVSILPTYTNMNGKGAVSVQYVLGKTPAYAEIAGKKSTASVVSNDYCFSTTGFHLFRLTDEAGNQMQYMAFLDGTKAGFVQTPLKNNANNIVSSDLTVTWGSHKSIATVTNGDTSLLATLFSNIYTDGVVDYPANANLSAFKNYLHIADDGKFYVNVPLTSVKVISALYNVTENRETTQIITPSQSYASTQQMVIRASLDTEGEYYFGVASASNIAVNGQTSLSEHYAIINTDNAQVTMYGYQSFDIAKDETFGSNLLVSQKTYVSPNRANNYKALKLEWNKGSGEYEVESITLKYYQVDISDTDSRNYPYAENPLTTKVLVGKDFDVINGIMQSEVLLSTPISTDTGVEWVTAEGKYEVVRKYYDTTKAERTYIYYVDRSNIIEYNADNECVIGQNIALNAGDKTFKDFQTSPTETLNISIPGRTKPVSAEIILTTNILPVILATPDNKYFNAGSRKLEAYKMNMNVYYSLDVPNKNGAYIASLVASFDKVTTSSMQDSFLDFVYSSQDYLKANAGSVNNFKEQGYYIIEISDSTGDWKDIISGKAGNTYTYAFKIENEKPEGYFYGQDRNGVPTSLINFRYTKDSELSFEIQQPLDEFMARVDEKNITITRTYFDESGKFVENELYYSASPEPTIEGGVLYEGVVAHLVHGKDEHDQIIDSENNAIITTDYKYARVESPVSEDFVYYYVANDDGFDKADLVGAFDSTGNTNYYTRSSNVINFNLLPKDVYTYDNTTGGLSDILVTPLDDNGNTYEYTYTITIRYEGKEESYITTSTNFYSNTQSMTIDHTPPSANIDALLGANMGLLREYGFVDDGGHQTLYQYVQADYNGERYYSYRANDFFAFGIDTNFTITTAQDATIQSVYYRKLNFDASSEKGASMQSVLPGDPNYYDYTNQAYSDAYRFSNNNSAYSVCGINSSVISFYNDILLKDASMRNADGSYDGYYEIVEMDDAGNTSSFVVLLNTQPTTMTVSYTGLSSADTSSTTLDSTSNQITALSASVTSINTIEKFMTITVRNQTTNTTLYTIRTDESTDMAQVYASINEVISERNNFYVITISNRFGANYTFMLGLTTSDTYLNEASLKTVRVDGEYRYALDLSGVNNGGIRLTSVTLRKVVEQVEQSAIVYDIVYDENGAFTIYRRGELAPKSDIIFGADDENYWFNVYFTDSAGRITDQSFYIGREGEATFSSYGQECYQYGNVYYSTDNVAMTFITGLYTYNISLANTTEDVTRLITEQVNADDGTTIVTLLRPTLSTSILGASGGRYVYTINLLSKLNNSKSKTYTVVIDNRLPAINLVNDENADKNAIASINTTTPNTSTSENIVVKWDNISAFQTTIYHYQLSMQRLVDGVTIDNVNLLAEGNNNSYYISRDREGTYIIHLSISLNGVERVTKYISFTIAGSNETMFTVEQLIDGRYTPISATDTINYGTLTSLVDVTGLPAGFTSYNSDMPVEVYFVNSDINIVVNGDKGIELVDYDLTTNDKYVAVTQDKDVTLTLYQIKSSATSPYSYEKLFAVAYISQGNSLALTDLYLMYGDTTLGDPESLLLNATVKAFDNVAPANVFVVADRYFGKTNSVTGGLSTIAQMNHIFMDVYYNNSVNPVWTIDLSNVALGYNDMAMVELNYAGIYSFRIYDKAGNEQMFVNSNGLTFSQYSLTLLTEVVVNVNDGPMVDNAYYNGNVYFDILNSTLYSQVNYTIYKNGIDYTTRVPRVNYSFTFSESGTYSVTYSAVRVAGSKTYNIPSRTLIFTIANPNESRLALDFTTLYNSYTIDKVYRVDTSGDKDVTSTFLSILDDHTMLTAQDLINNSVALGLGQYRVEYAVGNRNNLPNVYISFTFRISNQTASIYSSQVPGESTTKTVTITFNPYVIYRQLGECTLRITNYMDYEINASTAANSEVQTLTIEGVGNYYVQLLGVDDSVLSSFIVQIKEPLNTFAIVLIVVVSLVVVGGVTTFIVLRHRMKVR